MTLAHKIGQSQVKAIRESLQAQGDAVKGVEQRSYISGAVIFDLVITVPVAEFAGLNTERFAEVRIAELFRLALEFPDSFRLVTGDDPDRNP